MAGSWVLTMGGLSKVLSLVEMGAVASLLDWLAG